ncbi:Rrf2 family transcriptional regulator [Ancylobacter dichloromethanicus]
MPACCAPRRGRAAAMRFPGRRARSRIGHIIRVLDGPLAPLNCASKSAYVPCQDCEDLASCAVRITMSKVRDAMSDILDGMSLHDMVVFARVPDADLMYNI